MRCRRRRLSYAEAKVERLTSLTVFDLALKRKSLFSRPFDRFLLTSRGTFLATYSLLQKFPSYSAKNFLPCWRARYANLFSGDRCPFIASHVILTTFKRGPSGTEMLLSKQGWSLSKVYRKLGICRLIARLRTI